MSSDKTVGKKVQVSKDIDSKETLQLKQISEQERELYYKSAENAYLKQVNILNAGKPVTSARDKTIIINTLRQSYTLSVLLLAANMKRSTYHYNNRQLNKVDKYAEVKIAILDIYEKSNKTYGYPRITKALNKLGYTYDRKTVYKLMKELNIILPKKWEPVKNKPAVSTPFFD